MDGTPRGLGLAAIARCTDAWAEFHARIGHRFARAEARERAGRDLAGLLDWVPRKNGWPLAEAIGETGPRAVQRLLSANTWDTEGVRDDLRDSVVAHLGDEATGVLIVDERRPALQQPGGDGTLDQISAHNETPEAILTQARNERTQGLLAGMLPGRDRLITRELFDRAIAVGPMAGDEPGRSNGRMRWTKASWAS